jgi:hypothetical protein
MTIPRNDSKPPHLRHRLSIIERLTEYRRPNPCFLYTAPEDLEDRKQERGSFNMNRLALIIALCLLTGMAHATFEIQDPAAQIYEEQQSAQKEPATQHLEEETFCALDADSGKCFCVHRETGLLVTIVYEECVVRASKPADENTQ